ncbi:MAG TPA: DUF423 domain-containing protein [Stellaceae bacterium]|nr:DUF423 domain-containing protein [Stellaceae bacterium]
MRRLWIVAAGLNGLAAVAVGAAVQHVWTDDTPRALLAETGVRYGLPHAAALLALGVLPIPTRKLARGLLAAAGSSLALGVTLFAGTLYILAAGALPELMLAVPVGGSLMILGWGLLLAYGAALGRERAASAHE